MDDKNMSVTMSEGMDKLDTIFAWQKKFDEDLLNRRNLQHITRDQWIQMETLAMMDELSELINEVNYKWWKNPKPVDETRVKEELVDILHFFTSMCLKMGMSAQELCQMYLEKNKENFARQDGLSQKAGYESGGGPAMG